ncbi:MAG TPA: CBS domain-containing protein [Thermoplasmata archaeon]|jgi:CBS domain-containing protein|nr:CBS domain-containing protein [Thermoplasmata archaeon]HIH29445.1 CBS domain-containing protein [Thermoplasmata archaeon]
MLVKEIMAKQVITIEADESVLEACMIYKEKKVGCLVVTKGESCVGIVTERDLIERTICQQRDPETTKVHEIMSSGIKVVDALDTVEKALETMKHYKIKKLPVISAEKVVGIITVTDIAKARPDLSERFMESWMKAQWRD